MPWGIIRQNLWWALGYNGGLPLAITGLVMQLASMGMAGSSLLVVTNALRAWPETGPFPRLESMEIPVSADSAEHRTGVFTLSPSSEWTKSKSNT